jgi:PPP family 3-phenylpropionic acid transporter
MKLLKHNDTRNLWLIRLYYVFYFGGMGAISPFITLFYVDRGLKGTQIGLLNTIVALSCFISAPIMGRLADNSRRPRLILQAALFLSSITYYLLSLQTVFLYMAIVVGINALVAGGINPQSQIQALNIADKSGALYGSIRMCGSLGYAIVALISGAIIQKTSIVSGFYGFFALNIIAALLLFLIRTPERPIKAPAATGKSPKEPISQVIGAIFKNPELVGYLISLIIVSITSNGISFESVYMRQLGASDAVIGRLSTLGALVEIPMMLLADKLMRRRGAAITQIMGLSFYCIGTLVIVFFPSVTSFIILRIILGLSFALTAVSGTYYVVDRCPAQQAGTILAFFSVTVSSIIGIIISPISGLIFDWAGPHWLYVISAAGYGLGAAIIFGTIAANKKKQPDIQ